MIIPTGNIKVDDGEFSADVENYKEFWYAMVGQNGEGQSFDGNGALLRLSAAGGGNLVRSGKSNYVAPRVLPRQRDAAAAADPPGLRRQAAADQPRRALLPAARARRQRPRLGRPGRRLQAQRGRARRTGEGQVRGTSRAALFNGLWVLGMIAIALVVGTYITAHQRIHIPAWVPVIGQHRFVLDAELSSAPGVMPGQGQMVTVSGVPVGEIGKVSLKNGKAVLRLDIKERYAHIHRDATILLRPKTGLKDMVAELDPGTKGPELKSGATIGTGATKPDVNFDEFLAELDADTRDSLVLLVGGAGKALGDGNGDDLANVLRRFEPLSRHAAKATRAGRAAAHQAQAAHAQPLAAGLRARRSRQAARHLRQRQQRRLPSLRQPERRAGQDARAAARHAAGRTAGAGQARQARRDADRRLQEARPRRQGPRPDAGRPALVLARRRRRSLRDQIRPFTREAQPTAKKLVPAARRLAKATPDLAKLTDELNVLVNELAFKPKGKGIKSQSYLYHVPWANHNTNSVLADRRRRQPAAPQPRLLRLRAAAAALQRALRAAAAQDRAAQPDAHHADQAAQRPRLRHSLVASGQCPKEATG